MSKRASKNSFYVYAYLRARDSEHGKIGSPYYIGKGSGDRSKSKGKNEIGKPKKEDYIIYLGFNLTEDQAFAAEKHFIQYYGRIDLGAGCLRNKTDGGEGPSGVVVSQKNIERLIEYNKTRVLSEETLIKMITAHKKYSPSLETREKISKLFKGRPTWNKGISHTEEAKKKMSEFRRGRRKRGGWHHSEESKARLRESSLGRKYPNRKPMSEETKAKIAITSTGRLHSEQTKAKIGAVHRGKKLSEETKEKLRISHIGTKASLETRLKMSNSHKERYKRQAISEEDIN